MGLVGHAASSRLDLGGGPGLGVIAGWTSRLPLVLVPALVAITGVLATWPGPARAQGPVLAPPVTVDGPSGDLVGLDGFSVARDGTGGLVYLKSVSGVSHVFVSRLVGGTFQAPEQVDASLPGPSSQPVIGAGDGGVLLVAFINGGSLYVVGRLGTSMPFGSPSDVFDGASNPALQMTDFGKGYVAFTANDGAGDDVRAAFYDNGAWALEPTPLNAVAADDAGTGSGRPMIAAAGDGVAIVVWGENGHIYSRRVWGTSPSVVYEQADVPSLSGWTEVSAGEPSVASGGDSSYAEVVFHELLSNGSAEQSRVLMNRLHGSVYDGVTQPDGLSTPGASGADQPQVVESDFGHGLVTSARDDSNQLWATILGDNGASESTVRVDSLENSTAPDGTAGMDGFYSGLIAWQHDPGPPGLPEIRVRYFDASTSGSELVVSSPLLGPTDAAMGLATAGDISGDGAVVWVQGTGSSKVIGAALLYQPPGTVAASKSFQYARTVQPLLAWSPARESWGPVRYAVSVDGTPVADSTATSVSTPSPLTQGAHRWQVTAVNPADLSSTAHAATVFVDTVPPVVQLAFSGRDRAESVVHIDVSYTDAPAPEPAADASGIAEVLVRFGDGTSYRIGHGKYHVYKRAGRYQVTVIVKDRAGNTTTVVRTLRIAPVPRKRRHKKPKAHK